MRPGFGATMPRMGNLALEQFDQADAEEVIVLMDEVLLRVYQSPARIARVKDTKIVSNT